jgi:hypothetical protein
MHKGCHLQYSVDHELLTIKYSYSKDRQTVGRKEGRTEVHTVMRRETSLVCLYCTSYVNMNQNKEHSPFYILDSSPTLTITLTLHSFLHWRYLVILLSSMFRDRIRPHYSSSVPLHCLLFAYVRTIPRYSTDVVLYYILYLPVVWLFDYLIYICLADKVHCLDFCRRPQACCPTGRGPCVPFWPCSALCVIGYSPQHSSP